MFSRSPTIDKTQGDENPFLLSFSDLMVGLLVIYILVLILTLVELEKRKEELRVSKKELIESLEEIQQVQIGITNKLSGVSKKEYALSLMLKEIQTDLKRHAIQVVIAENGTVLRIPEQQLQFALGKYDVPAEHLKSAIAIGQALLKSLQIEENRSLLDTVFVEGHTDSVPNSREMGNWGLSTYRAISLWNFWTETPGQLAELKTLRTLPVDPSQPSKPLISVSGYADTRSTHGPLVGKEQSQDRPEDRRIDIRFTLVSSEKKDLEGLQEKLDQLREKTNLLIHRLKKTNHAD